MKQSGIFLFLCGSFLATSAFASGYNVSGKIIKPDGTAFSGSAVPFAIELVNSTGACVIYKEEFSVNMTDTKGAFHVVFGGPTANRTYPTSGTLTVESALKNTTGTHYTCLDNTTYTPAATDERSIRITFNDGNTWQIFSQQALKSVPSATSAKYATTADSATTANAVATFQASNLLRSSSATLPDLTATGAANFETLLTRFTDIQNLIDGNSSTYLKVAPAETDPSVKAFAKANLPTCEAGTVLTSSNGTNLTCVTDATSGGGGSLPAGTAGQFLKFDGANWISASVSLSDVSTLTTTLTNLNANKVDKSSFANCAASETLFYNSVGDSLSCTAITLAGDVSGTASSSTVAKIRGVVVANTMPANGQVLKFNGSQWEPATVSGAGTVTSIEAGTGLNGGTITGTGTISLSNTGVTVGTYGSATHTPTITVDAQGRVSSLTLNSIAFPVSSVAGRGGSVVLTHADITNGASSYFTYKPANSPCDDGQTLVWSTLYSRWECGTMTNSISGISASGDLTGTYPSPTINKIQGKPLLGTPDDGKVLAYRNNAWRPAALGCYPGYTKVNTGAPFCILYSSGTTNYASGTATCGSTNRANICTVNQLMHANSEGLLSAATYIITDQLGNNVEMAPIIYNRLAGTFYVGSSMTDTATVYCCRPQEYIEY